MMERVTDRNKRQQHAANKNPKKVGALSNQFDIHLRPEFDPSRQVSFFSSAKRCGQPGIMNTWLEK
jgi:hypothetical protein